MKKKVVAVNIMSSLLLQIVTVISGFIIPKVILSLFGSKVNGLIASITQFLNYITLLDGGVSSVIMASLYKPIQEQDTDKINRIVKAASNFFRTIGRIYVGYVIVVALGYYFFVDSSFSYGYIAALTIILGMNLFVQYYFSFTYKVLLNASGKVYIVSFTQILITVVNVIMVIVISKICPQVHVIRLGSAIVFFLQPIMYQHFVKKYYKLDLKCEPDNQAISQRWDGFGQNLAFFIHSNTDVVILTLFVNLVDVSVYYVYNLVVKGLKSLVTAISSAIVPSIGQVLAKGDKDEINSAIDLYQFGIAFVSTLFFTCGVIMILPFVRIYTIDITDGNYIRPVFAVLILLAEYVYCFRDPYVSVSYAAGHFRQTAKYAYMEAIVNIVVSLLLVKQLGLVGVAIGTLVSMILRMLCSVYYLKKNIAYRPIRILVKYILVFWTSGFGIASLFMIFVKFNPSNYVEWMFLAVVSGMVTLLVLSVVSYVFFPKEFCKLFSRFKKGK